MSVRTCALPIAPVLLALVVAAVPVGVGATAPVDDTGTTVTPGDTLDLDIPAHLADILTAIRMVESGERYDLPPNRGNASGAYQYIASTWNDYRGYPHAYLAPPAIQDERALADVRAILQDWAGDVSMVPVIWYYPIAARDPQLMDVVPLPGAGNRLTVREYQHRWLNVFGYFTGTSIGVGRVSILPEARFLTGIPPEVADAEAGLTEISFPVLGRGLVTPPVHCTDDCEGADAIVFGQKMQPILAATDGVVTAKQVDDPVSGAVTLTITDTAGYSYHYHGFNDDRPGTVDGKADEFHRFTSLAEVGTSVWAGQIVGFMGDTDPMPRREHVGDDGEPVWPHLRLRITAPDGTRLDADRLVAAAQERQACHVAIGPWSLPSEPGRAQADDRGDVVVAALADGSWTLHSDGTVTAVGRAALVVPAESCSWAPDRPFGPGGSGSPAPDGWGGSISIEPEFWVRGSGPTGRAGPVTPVRR